MSIFVPNEDFRWSTEDFVKLTGFLLKMLGGSVALSVDDVTYLAEGPLPDLEVLQFDDPFRAVVRIKESE